MPTHSSPEKKHSPSPPDDLASRLEKKLAAYATRGQISCARAHQLAAEVGISPLTVGQALDRLHIKIRRCQLGLFGHDPQGRIVPDNIHVPPRLKEELAVRRQDDRLPCRDAWELAREFGLSRLDICGACEKLDIRISHCQLGAF
ncbi:MAG: hypothetical protein JXQ27_08660 [Acidobacteria bacterium]|nr:hypothetical protein [Acidobacteriota bacterium]